MTMFTPPPPPLHPAQRPCVRVESACWTPECLFLLGRFMLRWTASELQMSYEYNSHRGSRRLTMWSCNFSTSLQLLANISKIYELCRVFFSVDTCLSLCIWLKYLLDVCAGSLNVELCGIVFFFCFCFETLLLYTFLFKTKQIRLIKRHTFVRLVCFVVSCSVTFSHAQT